MSNGIFDNSKLYQLLIDELPQLIFIKDVDLNYCMMNKSFIDVVGKPAEDIFGRNDFELFPKSQAEIYQDMDKKVLTSETPLYFEETTRIGDKDRVIKTAKRALCDQDTNVLGILGIAWDITSEVKEKNKLLKESRLIRTILELYKQSRNISIYELYSLALDKAVEITNSTVGFLHTFTDNQKDIVLTCWNDEAKRYCEAVYDQHYPISKAGNWVDCVKAQKTIIYNDFKNSPNQKGLPEGHFPIMRFMSTPVIDEDKVRIIFGVGNKETDYTDLDAEYLQLIANELHNIETQGKQKTELDRAKEFESNLLDTSNAIIIALDQKGRVTLFNEAAETITGFKRDEIIGKKWYVYLCPKEKFPEVWNRFSKLTDISQLPKKFETPIASKDGDRFDILWSSNSVLDKGRAVGAISFGIDITKQKAVEQRIYSFNQELEKKVMKRTKELEQAKKKAEDANRLKSAFLSNMSHEIRTPLNSIIGFSELLEGKLEGREQLGYLKSIKTASSTLLMLINDILDISKIEAGMLRINLEPVYLKMTVEDVLEIFKDSALRKGVELKGEVSEKFPALLMLDEVRFRQILLNLVGNAVKFTKKGSVEVNIKPIEIFGASNGERVDMLISIKDTGCGIEPDFLKGIFTPFVQQDSSIVKEYGGTGLGLAITKNIVDLFQGEISVRSEVGRGTTFEVRLRNIEVSSMFIADKKQGKEIQNNIDFVESSILIVDDIKQNRVFLKEFLCQFPKIKVYGAGGGEEAVDVFRKYNIDLVFIDINMPKMDGFEVAKRILSEDKAKKTVIIGVTASIVDRDNSSIKSRMTLFKDVLEKPIHSEKLLGVLMEYISLEKNDVTDHPMLKNLSKDRLRDLVRHFDSNVKPVLNEILSAPSTDDINKFLNELEYLKNCFENQFFLELSNKLKDHMINFEIGRLTNEIKDFEKLIERIRGEIL